PTDTPTLVELPTNTPTPDILPTNTPTPDVLPTNTPTPDVLPTNTPTPDVLPTNTPTPGILPTDTPTPIYTATDTPTPTSTPPPTATPTPTLEPLIAPIYLSLDGGGTVGGVAADDIDILYFDGVNWNLFFDASDVGISSSGQDLNDFVILDASTILLTFRTAFTLGTIAVDPWDIVQFNATSLGSDTAGEFSLYFDGNDVGLDTSSEVIDALDVLPDGRILISVTYAASVPGLTAQDEDILAFSPLTLGDVTSGTWSLYFDGTAVGLGETTGEDVDGLDVVANGDIYLTTLSDFLVDGVTGLNEDVFVCTPLSLGDATACSFAPSLYFDGSVWGLDTNDVDGIYIP
ncbi:MAG: hypothetical protein ACYCXH_01220, partial [Bellilinea sp.]